MRWIFIPSIRHSGTHVLFDGVLNREKNCGPLRQYSIKHCHPDDDDLYFHADPFVVVSPLRHPRRIAASWARYNGFAHNYANESFLAQFDRFMEWYAPIVTHYVHVDDPGVRDRQVEELGDALGLHLVGRFDRAYASVHKTINIDLAQCPVVPDEFIEFYESCKQ